MSSHERRRTVTRLHEWLVGVALPRLRDKEAPEVAAVFERLRDEAWRRSFGDWLAAWRRELTGLVAEAVAARRSSLAWPAPSAAPAVAGRPPEPATTRWLGWLWRDVVWSGRQLRRSPVFSMVAVGSVACGLAGAVVVFTVANAVLWRPLPGTSHSERLVRLFDGERGVWSYPDFQDLRRGLSGLDSAAAFATSPVALGQRGSPPRERMGQQISEGYFETLGAGLVLGRAFLPDDGDAVAIVGYEYWQRELGGAASILGESLQIRGVSHTVVGVAPPRLSAIAAPVVPDVYYPVSQAQREDRGFSSLDFLGRLGPGATLAQVRAQASALVPRLPVPSTVAAEPGEMARQVDVYSEREARVPPRDRSAILGGVGGAVAFTLLIVLIVCANLANMVLTRGLARRRELGVRLALGASRRRLVTQLVTESLVLAVTAGLLAVASVHALTAWLASGPIVASIPAGLDLGMDASVVGFALLASALAGVAFGVMPALEATRPNPLLLIRGEGGARSGGRFGLRRLLITAQIATSLVLIVAAVTLTRSLWALHDVHLGFDPDRVAVLPIDTGERHDSIEAGRRFFDRVSERIAALPGVRGVAFARALALGGTRVRERDISIEGFEPPPGRVTELSSNTVSPGYFAVAGIPMKLGREFDSRDRPGSPEVVVVDEAFVRRFWPDGPALGRRVGEATVVGVAGSTRYRSLSGTELPMVWRCLTQSPSGRLVAHVKTAGPAGPLLRPLERVVSELDPSLLLTASTWQSRIGDSLLVPRLLMAVFGAAGLLAVALAALGVYGVMSYAVSLRSREMGVRLALGASPARLMGQIVREGLGLSSLGLALGSLLSVGVVFGLGAVVTSSGGFDPVPVVLGSLSLAGIAALASFLPARRAASLDPARTLRPD